MRILVALLGFLTLFGCEQNAGKFREIRDGQRELRVKLDNLEKQLEKIASRPAQAGGKKAANPNRRVTIPAGESPFKGPKDAKVTIVEFSDFECPFCSKVPPNVEQVLDAYPKEVKFVYKEFPLSFHKNAMNASRAALAAHRQGKYWEMHDKMFENQRGLQLDKLKTYAEAIGLDVAKFEKDMADPKVQQQIDADMKLARSIGVTGTPTLFINGRKVTDRSPGGMKDMVAAELKKG